jgi:hypothetical protein
VTCGKANSGCEQRMEIREVVEPSDCGRHVCRHERPAARSSDIGAGFCIATWLPTYHDMVQLHDRALAFCMLNCLASLFNLAAPTASTHITRPAGEINNRELHLRRCPRGGPPSSDNCYRGINIPNTDTTRRKISLSRHRHSAAARRGPHFRDVLEAASISRRHL